MLQKYKDPTEANNVNAQTSRIARAKAEGTNRVFIDKFTNPVNTLACMNKDTLSFISYHVQDERREELGGIMKQNKLFLPEERIPTDSD